MPIVTELDIFTRLIDASNPTLTPEGAAGILQLKYSETGHQRMADLAGKSSDGTLTPDERREFESYVFVGDVLSLLKSKITAVVAKTFPGGLRKGCVQPRRRGLSLLDFMAVRIQFLPWQFDWNM